jgi:hypothetical protein
MPATSVAARTLLALASALREACVRYVCTVNLWEGTYHG